MVKCVAKKQRGKIRRRTGAALAGGPGERGVHTLRWRRFVSQQVRFHVSSWECEKFLISHVPPLAPRALLLPLSFEKKFCHSRHRLYFETERTQGCVLSFYYYYLQANRIVLVQRNFLFLNESKAIWNLQLSFKSQAKNENTKGIRNWSLHFACFFTKWKHEAE